MLHEIVTRAKEFYAGLLLTLPQLSLAFIILVLGIFVANWLSDIFRRRIAKKSNDPLMSNFLVQAIKTILIVALCMLALNIAGLSNVAGALLAAAGASAVVVGFAFKDIAENFLAGIILAFNRPFSLHDTVKIEEVFGKVLEMEFRYTKIRTFDGRNVYIPNSDVLTKPVYNYTEDGFFRTDFVVGISYEDDIQKAKEIIEKCFEEHVEVHKDLLHQNFVVEDELAPSTVNLRVYFWIITEDFRKRMLEVRGSLMKLVKIRLEEAGFNLPANITELKFYQSSHPIRVDNKPPTM